MTLLVVGVEAPAQEEIPAVFKAREVNFIYRSSTVLYPCHELQARVAAILMAVGARDDLEVQASGCEDFLIPRDTSFDRWGTLPTPADPFRGTRSMREETARVRIRLMTPVAVTPEVLAEIDKDKSRRELVSRVTGNPAAAMNDPIIFAAKRQTVTLSRNSIRLDPEDCELIEQMTTSVFRELDMRVVRRSFTCDPRQTSRIVPQLTVEALLPTGSIFKAPPAGEGDPDPAAPAASEAPPSETSETRPAQTKAVQE